MKFYFDKNDGTTNGDYTESDKNPFEVNVYESDGKIKAERIR